MEFLLLFVILAVAFVACAIASKRPLEWIREEWRLMWADTWEPPRAGLTGGTVEGDPKVRAMDERMRAYAKRLRREGRSLIAGKHYVPALTKPADPPPKAAKVFPIRKTTRGN